MAEDKKVGLGPDELPYRSTPTMPPTCTGPEHSGARQGKGAATRGDLYGIDELYAEAS